MSPLLTRLVVIMLFGFTFAFAHIDSDAIPDGVMPKDKRQAGATGATTTSQSSTPSSSSVPTTSSSASASTTPTSTSSSIPTTSSPASTSTSASLSSSTPATTSVSASSTSQTSSQSQSSTPSQTTSSDSSSSAASQSQSSSTTPSSVSVTTTNSDGSTITTRRATSTRSSSTSTPSSDLVKVGSSTINRATLSHKSTITQALVASRKEQSTFTSFWTSDGQRFSSVYTTDVVVASTTGFATSTISPSLANGGGNGSNLTTHSKAIIGGVVGGVGGAIVVAGLAFVFWRLYGKKKRQQAPIDDYDDLRQDKSSSPAPDTNGLERYRIPTGSVNTASNF